VQKVTIGFFTIVVALGLRFGSLNLTTVEPIIQSPTQIERQLSHSGSTQPDKAIDGFKSPSVSNLLKLSGGDLGKGSSPGARARSDARKAIANKPKAARSKPGGSGYAEAWSSNPSKRSRPAAANRLAQQFQTGPVEGGNGLFGRFSTRPTPDPYNSGCAGGPRSITVLSQSKSSKQDSGREITAHQTQVSGFVKNGKVDLTKCYDEVMRRLKSLDCENWSCEFEKFKSLAMENGKVDENSAREAITVLHGEMLGFYKNSKRVD
jgi:hypothetical protein